jgi:hypothetical protein
MSVCILCRGMNEGYPFLLRRMFSLWRRRWLDVISAQITQLRDRLQFNKIERAKKYLIAWRRGIVREQKLYLVSFLQRGKIAHRLLRKSLQLWKEIYTHSSICKFAMQSAAVVHYRDIRRPFNSSEQSV